MYVKGGTVNIPSDSAITTASIELEAGVYLLLGSVRWNAKNTNGYRIIGISGSENTNPLSGGYCSAMNPIDSSYVSQEFTTVRHLGKKTTLYLNVFQNSGSSLSLEWNQINAYRLSID